MENKAHEIMDELIDYITPSWKEFMDRRIKHINFARITIWLCIQSQQEDFIYRSELSKFIGLSGERIHSILEGFCSNRILRKVWKGNIVEYWFERDSKKIPLIMEYLEQAKKTIGFKIVLKKKSEDIQ